MHISRIQVRNFRNFSNLDITLGEHAVIVGENKIGKSNLLYALRLILDPSLPDSARNLRDEDFWDGLPRPLTSEDRIIVSVDIANFDNDENQLTLLAEHLVQPDPMVARLTYVWQPIPNLESNPTKNADYEFLCLVVIAPKIESTTRFAAVFHLMFYPHCAIAKAIWPDGLAHLCVPF